MGDNLIDFCEEGGPKSENNSTGHDSSDFPQTLVTEKIIFCIDVLLLSKENNSIAVMYNLLKSYFAFKKKICVRPPEFECLLLGHTDTMPHFNINNVKDIMQALKFVENMKYEDERRPLDLDNIFTEIASLVELPDPECCDECVPPNWVYHVVLVFGRNLYIPTMDNTNPFDYLMMSPYFALDILYMYDNTLKNNCSESIAHILFSLNQNGKGYFHNVKYNDFGKVYSSFAQFLGHPLMRPPQNKAIFNIMDLAPPSDDVKENNAEE